MSSGELWSDALAIVGIAAGVALVFVAQVGGSSFNHSAQTFGPRLVGDSQYQLQARGPAGASEQILYEARRLPGVRQALPLVEERANLLAPNGREQTVDFIGLDPHLAHMQSHRLERLTPQEEPQNLIVALPRAVADGLGVRTGSPLEVEVDSDVVKTHVGAVLDDGDLGNLARSSIALAPLGGAQLITGLETDVSRVFVQAQDGRGAQVLAGLRRLARASHTNLESASFGSRQFAATAAPAIAGERLFRVIGTVLGFVLAFAAALTIAPNRRVIESGVGHAAALGAIACVLGLLAGDLLSVYALNLKAGYLSLAFLVEEARVVTWQCVAIAVAVGMVASLAGGRGTVGRRSGSIATAMILAVAVYSGMSLQGVGHNLENGLATQSSGMGHAADLWVVPRGTFNPFATSSFPYSEREFATLPGVAVVGAYHASFLTWGARRLWVEAPAAIGGSPFVLGTIVGGDLKQVRTRLQAGGWAAVSESVAAEHGLRPGDTFTLPSPRPKSFRVAALISAASWPGGAIAIDPADYESAWTGSGNASAIEIRTESEPSLSTTRDTVQKAVGRFYRVETGADRARRYARAGDELVRPVPTVPAVFICCALALAAMIASSSLRRDSDDLDGSPVWWLPVRRIAVSLGVGCSIGAIFGLLGQLLTSRALAHTTGLPVMVGVDLSALVSTIAIVVVVGVVFAVAIEYIVRLIRVRARKTGAVADASPVAD